ncbi:MAG: ATP-binding cassette domain-containing protein [Alphaproteobacteria bacterium]|nr:ATP-binding cassette domain-containing protein [Alphaproteobacteria bacterium]
MSAPDILLEVTALERRFTLPRRHLLAAAPEVHALNAVDFTIARGHSFGVVGESGCGKSTLARLVMALDRPTAGSVSLLGRNLFALGPDELRLMRRHFQIVFQDPFGSLDPRFKVGRAIGEPLDALEPDTTRAERRERIAQSLADVGLKPADAGKYPHEFSGGQRQRIAIARALIVRPDLIVADEPVSALDVSVQAQVLNLMAELQERHGVTYMLISHDLAVVEHVAETIAVMYLGRIVEQGLAAQVFAAPRHPYTQALLDAVPSLERRDRSRRQRIPEMGASLDPYDPGCPFRARCPKAEARCAAERPGLREVAGGQRAACHFA